MLFWVSHYSRLKQISLSTWYVGLEKLSVCTMDCVPRPELHITFQNIELSGDSAVAGVTQISPTPSSSINCTKMIFANKTDSVQNSRPSRACNLRLAVLYCSLSLKNEPLYSKWEKRVFLFQQINLCLYCWALTETVFKRNDLEISVGRGGETVTVLYSQSPS